MVFIYVSLFWNSDDKLYWKFFRHLGLNGVVQAHTLTHANSLNIVNKIGCLSSF